MGYCTDYFLKIRGSKEKIREVLDFMTECKTNYELGFDYLGDFENFTVDDNECNAALYDAKWYEYDDDMAKLSQRFTDITFELTGFGEGRGDIWRHYYRNGKIQGGMAEIVFPEIEERDWE